MRRVTIAFSLVLIACSMISCCTLVTTSVADAQPWLYDQIHFEIAPVVSAAPSSEALDMFRERLHENGICRRDRVSFDVHNDSYNRLPVPWTPELLVNYESQLRRVCDISPEDKELHVFVAYIIGLWIENGRVRPLGGVQYAPTSFAIFKGRHAEHEASVLLHEFGHLIGLVKERGALNEDPDHEHHCSNKNCVMYWRAPSNNADFDTPCRRFLADLIRDRNPRR